MFSSLWHDRFVSGDDKHDKIDSADAGQHVLNEPLVAGHIDEPDGCVGVDGEICKTDIDRDAAFLLFLQAIRVDSGERFDERCFSVINVSCRTYDDVRHNNRWTSGNGSPITLK